jgi:hypothetical protein
MSHDALIVYATKDKVIADAICNRLENRKIRCRIAPRDLSMDGRHGRKIVDVLSNCHVIILVLSPDMGYSADEKMFIEKASSKSIPMLTYWIEDELSKYLMVNCGHEAHWLDVMDHVNEGALDRFIDMAAKIAGFVSQVPTDSTTIADGQSRRDDHAMVPSGNNDLVPGQAIETSSGTRYIIEKLIGKGAQGKIYQANASGGIKAVKWYNPNMATDGRKIVIESLISNGPPDETFIWPEDIVLCPGVPGFGYLMRMIEPGYISINDLVKCTKRPAFSMLATIGFNISNSFERLHSKGLCYADISPGNIFINADSGDIRICDNDNITVDGDVKCVLGTPKFMAPEIVCGKSAPNIHTDKYSLAVLLFYMLFNGHPLEGRRSAQADLHDKAVFSRLFGSEPLFIFDPEDRSNRPLPGKQDDPIIFWGIYPKFFRELCMRAFNENIRTPQEVRVSENDWMITLMKMRESIFHCRACGAENFYDVDALRSNGGKPGFCLSCREKLSLPPRMRIRDHILMLEDGVSIYSYHMNGFPDLSLPMARINHIQPHDGRIELKNLSQDKWIVMSPDSGHMEIEPGGCLTVSNGLRIKLGKIEGDIRV